MLNVILDVNGKEISNVKIENLKTFTNGLASYRVEASFDNKKIEAFFKHQRGDGALVCLSLALEALFETHNIKHSDIVQNYRRPDRI